MGIEVRVLLALALVIPAVAGLSPAPARAATNPCAVVTLGDSITWSLYASRNSVTSYATSILPVSQHAVGSNDTSYPGDLARLLHTSVCNYGVPGETTPEGLRRLRGVVRLVHPSTIVIMEGVNDLGVGIPPAAVLKNLIGMVDAARTGHVTPILATIVPTFFPPGHSRHAMNAVVASLNVLIRRYSHDRHVILTDVERAFQRDHRGAALTVDYVHPNDAGYRLIASTVAGTFRDHHLR